jgi:hypothetical protein
LTAAPCKYKTSEISLKKIGAKDCDTTTGENNVTKEEKAFFFENLYKGFEAENFIAGKLFGCGLEALKLPGDFGFDLLVTNRKQLVFGNTDIKRVAIFPYALQVKSRKIDPLRRKLNSSNRWEQRVNFRINVDEYDLLVSQPSSFLVCVAFGEYGSTSTQANQFWLSGRQLRVLKEGLYFKEGIEKGKEFLELQAVFREKAVVKKKEVLERIEQIICHMESDEIEEGEKEILLKAKKSVIETLINFLPQEFDRNDNTKPYVALERPTHTSDFTKEWRKQYYAEVGSNGENGKVCQLYSEQLDVSKIGMEEAFPVNDKTMKDLFWPLTENAKT